MFLHKLLLCLLVVAISADVDHVKKLIDSPVDDIQWADDNTIFILSEKSSLYRSSDGGKTWSNEKLGALRDASPDVDNISIVSISISEADPNYIFFIGEDSHTWVTTNMGASYTHVKKNLQDVRLHPTRAKWLLASQMSSGCNKKPKSKCYKQLLYSQDFGTTWKKSLSYVVQFDWSPTYGQQSNGQYPSDSVVFATVHSTKKGNQKFGVWDYDVHFVKSSDFFKDDKQIVIKHGNRFLFGDYSYLFVAQVRSRVGADVTLQISRDNATKMTFQPAQLPVDLVEYSYTILDTSEGSVFLHVNHQDLTRNAYAGHVYVSDWSGLVYSLSLPFNHRSADGKCDFEKVEGLEGIYLANFIDETEMDAVEEMEARRSSNSKSKKPKTKAVPRSERLHTKTVISFDKGAEWSYLTAPRIDSNGDQIKCTRSKKNKCTLHLHGITDLYGPFYSSASATGLIMATGSVGKYLQHHKDEINTYLSRDAGLTWSEVKKGSHIYEFGDHGGLIVMANDEEKTDTIFYSWDEGSTWNSLKISDGLVQVENIIIEPQALSQQFILYGWQDDDGVIIYLDFSSLHARECVGFQAAGTADSDYEMWSPSDSAAGRLNGKCLMGHTVSYTRRKRTAQCFNSQKFERAVEYSHCACTIHDFQCDFGYQRAAETDDDIDELGEDNVCVEIIDSDVKPFTDPLIRHGECPDQQRITKGYRRVPGDTCVGGGQWDAVLTPCNNGVDPSSSSGKFVLVGLFMICITLGFVTLATKTSYLDAVIEFAKGLFMTAASKGYTLVGGDSDTFHYTAAGDDDDGVMYLGDDFGPEPHVIDDASDGNTSGGELSLDYDSSSMDFAPLPQINNGQTGGDVPMLARPDHDDEL